ncbi:MAG TPA: hypothetical protein VF028_13735 [Actinomycetota bacterium]|nr:hypothetical protein [Actinomycetota bacterium]
MPSPDDLPPPPPKRRRPRMLLLAGFLGWWAVTAALDARDLMGPNDPDPFDVIPNLVLAAGLAALAVWALSRARG